MPLRMIAGTIAGWGGSILGGLLAGGGGLLVAQGGDGMAVPSATQSGIALAVSGIAIALVPVLMELVKGRSVARELEACRRELAEERADQDALIGIMGDHRALMADIARKCGVELDPDHWVPLDDLIRRRRRATADQLPARTGGGGNGKAE